LDSVIPANAGIQVFFDLATLPKMDAGFHRHDDLKILDTGY
jgi:hypothetical protein